jgi:cytolysin (calcineurin-like family phosphatase)
LKNKTILSISLIFFVLLISWMILFKPYMRYDKTGAYMIRTNLITGISEHFNDSTLKWENASDVASSSSSSVSSIAPTSYGPWTASDVEAYRNSATSTSNTNK